MTIYNVAMMMPWRRLAIYVAQKIAANPEARAKATDIAQQVGQEAKRIADDPSPARAAGRTARRIGEQLRRRINTELDRR
jgi:hypothetical protein